jgi:tetrapyrrole methylase family protein / MazG family protein
MTYPHLIKFVEIVQKLRSPDGCPWDKEQTHDSLKQYLVEETYEALDAIDEKDNEHLKEELGDVLLQVFLHAQIAKDDGNFDIEDIAREIGEKMIRRHPHVFGDTKVKDAEQVLKNWEEIKSAEKAAKGNLDPSILDSIPHSFPALFETHKISKKVAKLGFEWKEPKDVFNKVNEEIEEVKQAYKEGDEAHLQEELGDLLFTVANLCRVFKVNPELCLKQANKKFKKRFGKMEVIVKEEEMKLDKLSFDEWNQLWERVKQVC